MARPDLRPFHRLPVLEDRRGALETCTFCPKLCRSACPVSNVEPKETFTPWGKMSLAYFAAQGDVSLEPTVANSAWACTGCYGCRESCDHKNPVAPVLYTARTGFAARGLAPAGARRVASHFPRHAAETRQAVRELGAHPRASAGAKHGLLVGCTYARAAMKESKDAIDVTATLSGSSVCVAEECCGLPLLLAGDGDGFRAQAARFAATTQGFDRLTVVDPGCVTTLLHRYPEIGVTLGPKVESVVSLAARELTRLTPGSAATEERVRYHDPCQLGRGLGLYDEPRAVLSRLLGRAPEEFASRREKATCSGAGGLLPSTMPEASRAISRARLDEHERDGGGRVVTACASSLLAFRRQGKAPVDDFVSLVARGLPRSARPSGAPR